MLFTKSSSSPALPPGAAASRPTVPAHSSPLANTELAAQAPRAARPVTAANEPTSGDLHSSTSSPMRTRSSSPKERGAAAAPATRPPPSAFRSNRNSSGKGKEREQVARQNRPGRHPWLIDPLEARRNADLWMQQDRVILILGGKLRSISAPSAVANVYRTHACHFGASSILPVLPGYADPDRYTPPCPGDRGTQLSVAADELGGSPHDLPDHPAVQPDCGGCC